jgi:DNA-binding transcriptional LysR family regulator
MSDNRRWYVSDFAAKKEVLMNGMGWGGLPEHLVKKELESGELVRLYISGFDIRHSQLYLIRRTDKPIGIVAQAIWKQFVTK